MRDRGRERQRKEGERGRRERGRREREGEERGRGERERKRVLCFMIFCSPGNRKIKIASQWLYLVYHGL